MQILMNIRYNRYLIIYLIIYLITYLIMIGLTFFELETYRLILLVIIS